MAMLRTSTITSYGNVAHRYYYHSIADYKCVCGDGVYAYEDYCYAIAVGGRRRDFGGGECKRMIYIGLRQNGANSAKNAPIRDKW